MTNNISMADYITGVLYSKCSFKNNTLFLHYTYNADFNGVIKDLFDYVAKKGKPVILKGSDGYTVETANIKG